MRPNGQAIRAIRRAQKIGLRSLQQMTGFNRGYLSRLERGHIREPDEIHIRTVADALNVAPEAITHQEEA
ncbi:helix-turn-helix transcriptional regulator [Streptomyces sp. NPDC046866]|uniref:helix-turn-helix domain-containing protein n=1 Tax=Streptomyces sp. NPDC046866 TaxID=3154921 RepID=UPI003451B36C